MSTEGVRHAGLLMRMTEATLADSTFEPWFSALSQHVNPPHLMAGIVFEVRAEDLLVLGHRAAALMKVLRARHRVKFALEGVSSESLLRSCLRVPPFAFVRISPTGNDDLTATNLENVVAAAHARECRTW
jgi:hypothetical protein